MISNLTVGLEKKMKTRRYKNNYIQPCLLIVGTVSNPLEIMVYFDENTNEWNYFFY